MSDTGNGNGTVANGGRKMVSVNGKEISNGPKQEGNLKFVRPSKLTDADANTVVAAGIFEGTIENNFDKEKMDFKVRSENGDLTILNTCASLDKQLGKVTAGSYVEITYLGKKIMQSGKYKGKGSHSFVVAVAAEDLEIAN
jgi:hypothetical protein